MKTATIYKSEIQPTNEFRVKKEDLEGVMQQLKEMKFVDNLVHSEVEVKGESGNIYKFKIIYFFYRRKGCPDVVGVKYLRTIKELANA